MKYFSYTCIDTILYLLYNCVWLSSCPHLYCSSSLGSTERTTGLLSTHSRKGVSSLVRYTSPAAQRGLHTRVNASLASSAIWLWLSLTYCLTDRWRRPVRRRAAPPPPPRASVPLPGRTWTPPPGRRSCSSPWSLPAAQVLPWTREIKKVLTADNRIRWP